MEENTDVFLQNWHFSSLKWGFNEIFPILHSFLSPGGEFVLFVCPCSTEEPDCHYHNGSDQTVVILSDKKNFSGRTCFIYDIQFFIIHEPI